MLKGLAITPPILGRISIGKVVERNGKRLPEKDDQFTITSQVQNRDGWVLHPIDEELRKAQGGKIRSIPMRLMFNDPDLNFRANYSFFDRQTGRPICVGNGDTCKRYTTDEIESFPCPSPDACELAKGGNCKPYGRLNVILGEEDALGSFIFRTTGFNSIRTIVARLQYLKAVSGDRLACIPLELRLRGKSTRQSHGSSIYYVDITIRSGTTINEALEQAKKTEQERKEAGFDQDALDKIVYLGLANGAFEDNPEDAALVIEEFFPEAVQPEAVSTATPNQVDQSSLSTKMEAKAEKLDKNTRLP